MNKMPFKARMCEALPLGGQAHAGPLRAYIRICPQGHYRTGTACDGCASNGAILCNECPGGAPALLIRRDIWDLMLAATAGA